MMTYILTLYISGKINFCSLLQLSPPSRQPTQSRQPDPLVSTQTTASSSPAASSHQLNPSSSPSPQFPLTQTIATRSMKGIFKLKKPFTLSVTLHDPAIALLPKNPQISFV